jgi:hypothetical protein
MYALLITVPLELLLNVYRISRLTNWEIDAVMNVTGAAFVVECIGGTILLLYISKKWLDGRKASYWTAVLWFPYSVLMTFLFAYLFPITYGGDAANPVVGIIVIGGLFFYPFYILTVNFLSMPDVETI